MAIGTITRRMDHVLDELEEEFRSMYSMEDFEWALEKLYNAGNGSNRINDLARLYRMFDAAGISYELNREYEYYENLVQSAALPTQGDMEDRIVLALFSRFQEFPSPQEYMERIVRRLLREEDKAWAKDSLRLRILKQFIKYGNYLEDAGYQGAAAIKKWVKAHCTERKFRNLNAVEEYIRAGNINVIDESIFDLLNGAAPEKMKMGSTYGLLKLCDDLASGWFKGQGSTKKSLYMFAMAYGMTYDTGMQQTDDAELLLNSDTDLEKNLFRDYYANNLMLNILDEYTDNLAKNEKTPSGQGINYKNFAEMVYLYYIAKGDTMDAADKIRRSSQMIKRLQNTAPSSDVLQQCSSIEGRTEYYRSFYVPRTSDSFYAEDIFSQSEEEFEAFIRDHYDCRMSSGGNALTVENEQNTAYAIYCDLRNEITLNGTSLESCNYGLWFSDTGLWLPDPEEAPSDPAAATSNQAAASPAPAASPIPAVAPPSKTAEPLSNLHSIPDRHPEVDREQFASFERLLIAINNCLGVAIYEEESHASAAAEHRETSKARNGFMNIARADDMSRTALLVAYYYCYNSCHEDEYEDVRMSFGEFFREFKYGIDGAENTLSADGCLTAAGYQPLSAKNIFDVALAFSSYAYLHL